MWGKRFRGAALAAALAALLPAAAAAQDARQWLKRDRLCGNPVTTCN